MARACSMVSDGASVTRSPGCRSGPAGRCRSSRQVQDTLRDEVALDLGSAAADGVRTAEQEAALAGRSGVVFAPAAQPDAWYPLFGLADVATEQLAVGAENVQGEVHGRAVRLGPPQLGHGGQAFGLIGLVQYIEQDSHVAVADEGDPDPLLDEPLADQ